MSTELASKCVDKALRMQEKVKNNFNDLHDINLLFDFSVKTENSKKNKKTIPILKKEGFELLSEFGLLKQLACKCPKYNVDFRLIT